MKPGFACAFAMALLAAAPVAAIELSQRGPVLVLSGEIKMGDEYILRDYLRTPQGQTVKILQLHNSPGGYIDPTYEMAREIRKRGLTTLVDASRSACNSACTGLFVAGVKRHYINAGGEDGRGSKLGGLRFHEGSSNHSGRRQYSGFGTARMIDIYYEMGAPGAAKVVSNADFRDIYRISGQTALSLGIATSLSPP